MRYFPIFIDLKGQSVIVVGGGEEALRKVRLLLKSEAKIGLIAPELLEELESLVKAGGAEWIARRFAPMLLDDAALVYSADQALNEAVSLAARERGIPVNAVDDAALSSFIVPAIVDRDPLVVAIGTEGAAPVLAMGLRAKIDQLLPTGLGRLAKAAEALRPQVAATVPAGNRRRGFWQQFFFGSIRHAFLNDDSGSYEHELERVMKSDGAPQGRVNIIEAPFGDPELLTLKAHRKLIEADVIVHDRRIAPGILELARRDAVRVAVAPIAREVAALLAREAKAGKHVVRLAAAQVEVERDLLEAEGIVVEMVLTGTPQASAGIIPFPTREDIREAALRAAS